MSTKLATIIADFRTQLTAKVAVSGTTATLQSATDDDSVALPAGVYFFTIDGENSSKEHIRCDLSGTALSGIKSVSRQGVQTTGFAREHRVGASVVITNFAHIRYMLDLLDATTDLDASNPLKYDGTASILNDEDLATKKYIDDVAIAGGAKATDSVYGLTTLSVAAVSPTDPIAVGDNDPRVPTADENNAMVGTSGSPSTTNKFATENDTANGATITASTIAFVNSSSTITDSGNGFVSAGFRVGDTITVSGTASNDGAYTITVVAAGVLTVSESVVDESAGSSFTIVNTITNKIARRDGNGDVIVPTTPTSTDGATSKAYVDALKFNKKVSISTSQVAIVSSTTETSLGSFSLLADLLSTNNAVKVQIPFTGFEVASTKTCTIRLKYGSTTVATAVITSSIGGSEDASGMIEIMLIASGATNTQKGIISLIGNATNKYSESALAQLNGFDIGTSAEDSTGDLTLEVTAQMNNSSADDRITTEAFIATLITT